MPLFRLLVLRVLLAPLAMLGERETLLDRLLILRRVVVHPLALGALELDQCFLGHSEIHRKPRNPSQILGKRSRR